MNKKEIKKDLIYKTSKKFIREWTQSPSVGFLAGYHKTTIQTVVSSLHQLEKEKKIIITSKKNHKLIFKLK